jgi:phosphatidylserine decarboxylase
MDTRHQYIDRATGSIKDEGIIADPWVNLLYSSTRERWPFAFNMMTGPTASRLLAWLNYDLPLPAFSSSYTDFVSKSGIDLTDILGERTALNSARKMFERKIRYWETRPMDLTPSAIVSPSDARVITGSFEETSALFIKEKFFRFDELLSKCEWNRLFIGGDFAIFRLTPEKYHYNHVPASGRVIDIYRIDGRNHSCNPVVASVLADPLSKNARTVTIIDTDVEEGAKVGLVAMIEITALMIGVIEQRYSEEKYDNPLNIVPGMFIRKGMPKSLFRPGSSTTVLVFQKGKVTFAEDILRNLSDTRAKSRFSMGLGRPLIETDLKVRSTIARSIQGVPHEHDIPRIDHTAVSRPSVLGVS